MNQHAAEARVWLGTARTLRDLGLDCRHAVKLALAEQRLAVRK